MTSTNQEEARPSAQSLLELMRNVVVPMCGINRTVFVPDGRGRLENDAEHSFSLGVASCCFAPLIDATLDVGLVAQYALVHDFVEVYAGDTSVYAETVDKATKSVREAQAFERIIVENQDQFPWLVDRLRAYYAGDEPESRFVYAMDKLLPHAMVLLADAHPLRRTWAEYAATERAANAKIAEAFPKLLPIFVELCAEFAKRPHLFADDELDGS
ncbi:HD domain-containing protein [Actinophytocola xanthii]|uniref:HD domain-containing protein n=1 Tax=Actinophytocola xanthii TaxID=1912961 RepID=A0A1Q8C1P8_9PSEU|nr:HD domain-containing protein [Actinophytocola xanthii]OLF08267.1 hypothetical protein BU204_34650 [Actinophytocola xanthii]